MLNKLLFIIFTLSLLIGCNKTQENTPTIFEGEQHLSNLRMLTQEGENAEAYFNPDETRLIFQSSHDQYKCDQIFSMQLDGSKKTLLSTGQGKTTCSYFFPDNQTYIYASTHGNDSLCPPAPDYSQGYVWPIYYGFELYVKSSGSPEPLVLSPAPGYDAEATISPKGDKIVFTSQRSGDLEIFTMNLDGSDLKQITFYDGFDGFPMFTKDVSKLVFASNRNNRKPRDTNIFLADWKE